MTFEIEDFTPIEGESNRWIWNDGTPEGVLCIGREGQSLQEFVDEHNAPEVPVPPSAADVIAERERRLAFGFDYDFEDARGVHHIATSPEDMKGWDEVTMLANAAINAGVPATEILILTSTGPVTVTATEWQQVLLASANFRQPIWQASFALQAMDPIPADFTDATHWPG